MSAPVRAAGKERLLPEGSGVRRFAAAGLLNAVGSGFFISFALLFFKDVAALPLSTVGPGLTAASLAVLPLLPALGRLADRIGPHRLLVAASLARAAAFAGFLLLDGLAAFLVLAMLSSLGTRAEQIGSPLLAAALAGQDSAARSRWLALYRTIFNAGIGGGALLGGLLVTGGVGYPALGLCTAVGFALAAALYPTGRASDAPVPTDTPSATATSASTDTPASPDAPAATDTPAAPDAPAATDTPAAPDAPAATDTPAAPDAPAATD
ncbi:MFS transporter, partial [Streptomyces sp. NPDC059894]|uniref:MFS transporter n=1 Tax=Streptomyces sp. NPDC059894 TaxID=3346991 RepID=UPI0036483502